MTRVNDRCQDGKVEELQAQRQKKIMGIKRRKIRREHLSLTKTGLLDGGMPLCVTPTEGRLDLIEWAIHQKSFIENELLKVGAILFRGFELGGIEALEHFITKVISPEILHYTNRSTPRKRVKGGIYTATEYPADQTIPLHNETAYDASWAMKIMFYCVQPPEQGGETPIADSRGVYRRIDPRVVRKFAEKGVMYVRNYGELDLSWREVFQTEHKEEVESHCRQKGIAFEWLGENQLRTRQVSQGVARHPVTGEMVWFNQAHLFHVSNLKPEVRKSLRSIMDEERLPRNAYWGDGSRIESAILEEVREAYRAETRKFSWEAGDVMLLDNMLTAHGRMPFQGNRQVVVGLAESCQSEKVFT